MADSGFLGQGTAPGITTVDDMINMFFQSIFGPLGGTVRGLVDQGLGINTMGQRAAFLDTVIYSNLSPYGTYQHQQNAYMNRMSNVMLGNANRAAQLDWMRNMTQTMTSFATWSARPENAGLGEQAYQAWLDREAQDKADNFIWGMGYKMLDPQGFGAASQYLSQAAGNISRRAMYRGQRGAFIYGRADANIFTDDNGGYAFNSADYGHMSIGEASAVTAALTKDLDIFKDTGFDRAKIQEATQKLRSTVQEYTQALAPLKDVFGSDIPAMIQAVEQLSGKRLAQISPDRLGPMVERVMAGATVGGYSIGQLVGMNQQLTSAMGQMGVPYINTMGTLAMAENVLAAINGGTAPVAMRMEQFAQQATNWTLRTSNSAGADAINRAWAISGMSFEDFRAQLGSLERQGYSTTRALETITGQNMAGINYYGAMSDRLLQAVQADFGGQVARAHDLDRMIASGRFIARGSDREAYDQAVELIRSDIRYLNDTAFRSANVQDAQVAGIITGIQNGLFGPNLATAFTASATEAEQAMKREKQQRVMRSINALKTYHAKGTAKELINAYVRGEGSISELFTSREDLALGDEAAKADFEAFVNIFAADIKDLSETERSGFLNERFNYLMGKGATNQVYLESLYNVQDAQATVTALSGKSNLTAADKKALREARATMRTDKRLMRIAESSTNPDLLAAKLAEEGGKDLILNTYEGLSRQGVENVDIELTDRLRADTFNKSFNIQNAELERYIENIVAAEATAKGGFDVSAVTEELTKAEATYKKEHLADYDPSVWEEARRQVRLANYGEANSGTQMLDLFGKIDALITAITKLINGEGLQAPKNESEGRKPNQG